jgi:hypothetical protein
MMKEHLMVQQQVKNKWQHMVGVICLNQTYRKQVKEVLPKLFARYPDAKAFLRAGRKSSHCRLIQIRRRGTDCYSRSTVFREDASHRLGELLRPQVFPEGLAGWDECSHNYLLILPYRGIVCWDTTEPSPARATT